MKALLLFITTFIVIESTRIGLPITPSVWGTPVVAFLVGYVVGAYRQRQCIKWQVSRQRWGRAK